MNTVSLIEKLKNNEQTISTMESCTGGALASEITNHSGSSNVFENGAITYSNEAKVRYGVSREIIEKYTVYSKETAVDMSKSIAEYFNTTYGVGITGQLEELLKNRKVDIAIYNKEKNIYNSFSIQLQDGLTRKECKEQIIIKTIQELNNFIG